MKKLLLLITSFLLSGCGLSPVYKQTIDYYTLSSVQINFPHKPKHGILWVGTPKASSELQSDSMIYSKRPFQLDTYVTSRWMSSPAELLNKLLLESFKKARAFQTVINNYLPNADWKLEVTINKWYQDFTIHPNEMVISFIADLIDLKAQRILNSKILEYRFRSETDDAYGGVLATNKIMQKLVPELIDFAVMYSKH